MSYTDAAAAAAGLRFPTATMPQRWPAVQSSPLPPPQSVPRRALRRYGPPHVWPAALQPTAIPAAAIRRAAVRQPPYGQPQYRQPQYGSPPYGPPAITARLRRRPGTGLAGATLPGRRTAGRPCAAAVHAAAREPPAARSADRAAGRAGPVEVKPPATLACPIVSALDKWISGAVQPAALKWFRQPVVEIKQISAYSCRGMNGNPNAHISEHAFGNALDIAEFDLADGHKVSVQYGWHGIAGGAGLSARRAGRRLPGLHHRAGAGRQRLSLQSHPRRSDAARGPAATSASRPPFRAKSPPRARARNTPPSITAIPASPARSEPSSAAFAG